MKTHLTQQYLDRLSSLLRNENRSRLLLHGLQPVQFDALQYLMACNHYSDTPMAVTEFLGQTKGTVSQTLKVLEKKGFVTKTIDQQDKRVVHLSVTSQGSKLIKQIQASALLQKGATLMSDEKLEALNSSLELLLNKVQLANQLKTFGECHSCLHHTKLTSGGLLCGLTQERLLTTDAKLICREHHPL
tara:strand:- start:441 stop:1004 length:564 start_codon:yes stop_codon:yes gene_type:complete